MDFMFPSSAMFEQPLQFGSYLDKWLTSGVFQLSLISQKDVWTNENALASLSAARKSHTSNSVLF